MFCEFRFEFANKFLPELLTESGDWGPVVEWAVFAPVLEGEKSAVVRGNAVAFNECDFVCSGVDWACEARASMAAIFCTNAVNVGEFCAIELPVVDAD